MLFVLSNDFGELAIARYLVRGQAFQPVFCMPDVLYSVQGDSIPYPAHRYRSVSDVMSITEQVRPDIVFLFSGYLYAINNIFSIDAVGSFVQELQRGSCRIATSDPFLGLMSDVTASTFSDSHPLKQWLQEHFGRVNRIFKNITHMYLVDTRTLTHSPSVSFFNKNMIVGRDGLAECSRNVDQWTGMRPAAKRWLFVLSMEDYAARINRLGKDQFDDLLFKRLQEAAVQNKQPVLVGPQIAIDSLHLRRPLIDGLVMIPFASYDQFLSLLLDAEYTFYWNILSNSILFRAINDLPVFFFDPGHMLHAIQPLGARAMDLYYADAEMPFLNGAEGLSSEKMSSLAALQRRSFARTINEFRRLPDPELMVGKILSERAE